MTKLDDKKLVAKLDPNQALNSIDLLGEQIIQAWEGFKKVRIPSVYHQINKIVVNGMGGSQLGAHLLSSVYFSELKKPITIINGYDVPAFVDSKTLYIISSYSGDTEEPLATLALAKKKQAKIFGIAAGGQLGSLIRRGEVAGYVFNPTSNPSGQPRLGLGYSLAAQLALFRRLGLIKISDADIQAQLKNLEKFNRQFGFNNSEQKNPAKKIARALAGKTLALAASEHLAGGVHIFANQANETGKTLSTYYLIPELNHHLLEGLKNPKANQTSLMFVFFESKLYHPKNQRRYKITQQVVRRNNVKYLGYTLKSFDRLGQALELLSLSSYVTFYLAMLNNINPNLIPWVDYFKRELKKKR